MQHGTQTAVTILGILTIALGTIEIAATVLAYFEPNAFGMLFILHWTVGGLSYYILDGAAFFAQGAISVIIGISTLRRYNAAWMAHIVYSSYRIVFGSGWTPPFIPMILNGLIIYFMFRPSVKALFRYKRADSEPQERLNSE